MDPPSDRFQKPIYRPAPKLENGKSKRRRYTTDEADYIIKTTLFGKMKKPMDNEEKPMSYLHKKLKGVTFPQVVLNGKTHHICLRCSFPAPYNRCWEATCISVRTQRRDKPPLPRLHIDLDDRKWTAKPPEFWDPIIEFLQHPKVRAIIPPSEAFKKLVPHKSW